MMISIIERLSSFDIVLPVLISLLFAGLAQLLIVLTDARQKRKRAFKNDIVKGIANGMLQWDDLEILCQRWSQSRTDLYWVLSDLLHESLCEETDKSQELYKRVKELLSEQQRFEPFAELPESIRMHMEQLSSRFRENGDEVVRPLATSIYDTIIEADRRYEKQKIITKYSFVVGVISLLIGIASLFFAVSQISSTHEQLNPTIKQSTEQSAARDDKQRGDFSKASARIKSCGIS